MIAARAPSTSTPSAMPGAGHSATKARIQYGAQRQPLRGASGPATPAAAGSVMGEFVIDGERGLLHGLQRIACEPGRYRSLPRTGVVEQRARACVPRGLVARRGRPAERRGGEEVVRTCRAGWE